MDKLTRRRLSKILYYRYFDLSQSSSFLGDKEMLFYSKSMMNIVSEYIKGGELFCYNRNELLNKGLPLKLIDDIFELKETGNINYVVEYKSNIPCWIHPFISPLYLDLVQFRDFIEGNNIYSYSSLRQYFNDKPCLLSDFEHMLYHALTYMDETDFPIYYYNNDNPNDAPHSHVCDTPIKGTLHNHTLKSDGYCSLNQIIDLGVKLKYEYIGISDHSHSTLMGISKKEIEQQHSDIECYNSKSNDIHLLKGIECEILHNGDLDYSKTELACFDYIIAGIHTHFDMNQKDAEKRITKAIESGYVDILAHPSNRIYGSKPGFDIDMRYIIDACVSNNVVIEINGNKKRLDLDPKYVEYASNKGALFEIAADTHNVNDFYRINNAIAIVEDCHISEHQIINTFGKDELISLFSLMKQKK